MKTEKNKIEVGQKVFIYESSHRGPGGITETTVAKVGNKYFEVEGRRGQFYVDSMKLKTEFANTARIYLDIQEYNDEREVLELSSFIRTRLNGYGAIKLPLQKLRDIKRLLEHP